MQLLVAFAIFFPIMDRAWKTSCCLLFCGVRKCFSNTLCAKVHVTS